MPEAIAFYFFSSTMLTAALFVVFSRHPVYSVLALLVAMFCLAALFVMLEAYLIAALQILLYAGAVLVLFLFVIMLLNVDRETLARLRPLSRRGVGMGVTALLCAVLLWLVRQSAVSQPLADIPSQPYSVEQLGRLLFTTYLIPFELTSFLLLAAIVAAVTLARGMRSPKA